jgi:hypothetical protein
MTELTSTERFFQDLRTRIEGSKGPLDGKKALVLGIANNQSIAYGCALAQGRPVPVSGLCFLCLAGPAATYSPTP